MGSMERILRTPIPLVKGMGAECQWFDSGSP